MQTRPPEETRPKVRMFVHFAISSEVLMSSSCLRRIRRLTDSCHTLFRGGALGIDGGECLSQRAEQPAFAGNLLFYVLDLAFGDHDARFEGRISGRISWLIAVLLFESGAKICRTWIGSKMAPLRSRLGQPAETGTLAIASKTRRRR
jgi:hypothetical protein